MLVRILSRVSIFLASLLASSILVFLVMTLLYVPCVAAVAAFKRETGSWKWTFFMIAYTTLVGYGGAVLVYQGGRLLGLG